VSDATVKTIYVVSIIVFRGTLFGSNRFVHDWIQRALLSGLSVELSKFNNLFFLSTNGEKSDVTSPAHSSALDLKGAHSGFTALPVCADVVRIEKQVFGWQALGETIPLLWPKELTGLGVLVCACANDAGSAIFC